MSQPESRLSRKIIKALNAHDAFAWKNHGSSHMMAGLPDISCVYMGHHFGFETKMPGMAHNTSAIQDFIMAKIRAAGGTAMVITSVNEALNALSDYANSH